MAPLLQRQTATGRMKECWALRSSSPSLSLSLIDMWNLGLSLAKGDREKARERDREREKRPRSPSGTLEGCWALSGQRLTQTVPSLSLFLWPRLQSSALRLTTLLLYFCVNLPVIFPSVLTCQSICLFVLLSVFWWCLFLLLFFSPFLFLLFFLSVFTLYTQGIISIHLPAWHLCHSNLYISFPKYIHFCGFRSRSHYTACELSKENNMLLWENNQWRGGVLQLDMSCSVLSLLYHSNLPTLVTFVY